LRFERERNPEHEREAGEPQANRGEDREPQIARDAELLLLELERRELEPRLRHPEPLDEHRSAAGEEILRLIVHRAAPSDVVPGGPPDDRPRRAASSKPTAIPAPAPIATAIQGFSSIQRPSAAAAFSLARSASACISSRCTRAVSMLTETRSRRELSFGSPSSEIACRSASA